MGRCGLGRDAEHATTLGPKAADMKVVLFCGGLGTRIREYSESIPKPMIPVGNQPILWHIMQYYSQYRAFRLRAVPRL